MAAGGYPLINQFYSHPQVTAENLLSHLLTTAIAACGAAWIGQTLGNTLATANKQVENTAAFSPNLRLVPPIALTAVVLFIVLFVATAVPPG
jgi:ABC-type proline/glycine betaine transport system permease subunit